MLYVHCLTSFLQQLYELGCMIISILELSKWKLKEIR